MNAYRSPHTMNASASQDNLVTHVIFDLDGLILDTEKLFTEANERTLTNFGRHFTWEMKERMMGRNHDEAIAIVLEMNDLSDRVTIEEYSALCDNTFHALLPTTQMMPGAERLVKHLAKHKIPLAICTGCSEAGYRLRTESHRVFFDRYFQHYLAASTDADVKNGKPAPDCYLVCINRFNPPVQSSASVLVFEDAPNGVQAAITAGAHVVMVPDPRVGAESRKLATQCLDSLEQFDPAAFMLPGWTH